MTAYRYGNAGTVMSLLAIAGFVGSYFVPLPGRPAPGHEHEALLLVQEWGRVLLFYGSAALLILAVVFWFISRKTR